MKITEWQEKRILEILEENKEFIILDKHCDIKLSFDHIKISSSGEDALFINDFYLRINETKIQSYIQKYKTKILDGFLEKNNTKVLYRCGCGMDFWIVSRMKYCSFCGVKLAIPGNG